MPYRRSRPMWRFASQWQAFGRDEASSSAPAGSDWRPQRVELAIVLLPLTFEHNGARLISSQMQRET